MRCVKLYQEMYRGSVLPDAPYGRIARRVEEYGNDFNTSSGPGLRRFMMAEDQVHGVVIFLPDHPDLEGDFFTLVFGGEEEGTRHGRFFFAIILILPIRPPEILGSRSRLECFVPALSAG